MDSSTLKKVRRTIGLGCASVIALITIVVLVTLILVARGHLNLDDHMQIVLGILQTAHYDQNAVALPLTGPHLQIDESELAYETEVKYEVVQAGNLSLTGERTVSLGAVTLFLPRITMIISDNANADWRQLLTD